MFVTLFDKNILTMIHPSANFCCSLHLTDVYRMTWGWSLWEPHYWLSVLTHISPFMNLIAHYYVSPIFQDVPCGSLITDYHFAYTYWQTSPHHLLSILPNVYRTSPVGPSNLVNTMVPLPQRVDRHPDFSTSDEDDEDMGSPVRYTS